MAYKRYGLGNAMETAGPFYVIPTIGAAILITWQTRHIKSELFHNLAVICWIFANAYWMITEFFSGNDDLRYYTVIPFSVGIVIISWFYLSLLFKNYRNK